MKLLKEDLETKKSYTVAVTYAATINVIVDANSEEEAIQLAQSGTGLSSSLDNEYFIVHSDYEIDSLDYGDTPIIESTILDSKVNLKSIEIKPLTTDLGYLAFATDLSEEEIIQIIEDESYYDNEKLDREITHIITNKYDGELSDYNLKLDSDKVIIYDIELEEDDEDYLVENELVNREKLKMSDMMAASMPRDENVNFYLSDEHANGYSYLIITHPTLGEFIVSTKYDGSDTRVDGKPWEFLQRPRHKLSSEQIDYINSIKNNLKFRELIKADKPEFTNKDFEGGKKLVYMNEIPREKRVDSILSDEEEVSPDITDSSRGFQNRLNYTFKNAYPAGKDSLPIKILKILKDNGPMTQRQINEILGKPAGHYITAYMDMDYVGFIDKIKEGKSAVKYSITDAGLKYLNNAKRKA